MRNSLRALEGVSHVDVDLEDEIALVIYHEALLDTAKLIATTTNIGFPSAIKSDQANTE